MGTEEFLVPSSFDSVSETELRAEWEDRRRKVKRGRLVGEVIIEIERLGANGFQPDDVRQFYGIEEQPWADLWKDKPEAVLLILQSGRQKRVDFAANKLFEHVQRGNLKAIMSYLKTVGKWREMDKLIEDEKARVIFPAVSLTINDPLEAAKIYKKIMTETSP